MERRSSAPGVELNPRLSRSDFRSSFPKPRLANVSVSTKTTSATYNESTQSSNYPYRLPLEDYDNVGTMLYRESPLRASVASERGKVKDLATSYEKLETKPGYSPPISPSRQKLDKEIKEMIENESPMKKRLNISQQTKLTRFAPTDLDESSNADNASRKVNGVHNGKSTTIETRVNRYRKVGAVSVFPD